MQNKIEQIFFYTEIIAFELVALNTRFYWERILVTWCQYLNKQSQNFRYYGKGLFGPDFVSEWSKNMKKILSCRFMQCFGPVNMLTIHKCSDTCFLGILVTPLFPVYNYRNKYRPKLVFCFEVFRIPSRFRKCRKKLRKYFLILR